MVFLNEDVHRNILQHVPFLLLPSTAVNRRTLDISTFTAHARARSAFNRALGRHGYRDIVEILSAIPGSIVTGPVLAYLATDSGVEVSGADLIVPWYEAWRADTRKTIEDVCEPVVHDSDAISSPFAYCVNLCSGRALCVTSSLDPIASTLEGCSIFQAFYLNGTGVHFYDTKLVTCDMVRHPRAESHAPEPPAPVLATRKRKALTEASDHSEGGAGPRDCHSVVFSM